MSVNGDFATTIGANIVLGQDLQHVEAIRENSTAENHHPGGTGPPESHELSPRQAAPPALNLLKTMQLKELPLVARHWHSACALSVGLLRPEEGGDTNEIQGNASRQYAATKGAVNGEPERFVP